MNRYKIKISKWFLPAMALTVLGLTACDQDEEKLEPMRMFMPAGNISAASGEESVKLTWKVPVNTAPTGVTYTVEVAADTLFQTPVVTTAQTDTSGITFTTEQLQVRQRYFARIKANAMGERPESKWITSNGFSIRGAQIFTPFNVATTRTDIKATTVLLKWRPTADVTRIRVGPQDGGSSRTIELTPEDVAASQKLITELAPQTAYVAEIYANNTGKGTITFTTKEVSAFTVTVAPDEDLAAVIAAAANNDVIGLEEGIHNLTSASTVIREKFITLQSITGNPANTRVNFKEFTLKGTGAGVKMQGITFDGEPAAADYFLNLTGANADADAATFVSITLENCVVRNTANCLLRGNRGGNNAHKIDFIKLNNCLMYNSGDSYTYFTMDKMEFNSLELTNNTFYNVGRAFIGWATNITGQPKPTVLIEHCTINNFGSSGRNQILFDANANPVNFTMQNSIIANTPKPTAAVGNNLLRASGAGSVIEFKYNNYFKLENGASPSIALTIPTYVTQSNNKTGDLGWNATTTDFTLPAGSELRTASTTGGPIGDPRWAL